VTDELFNPNVMTMHRVLMLNRTTQIRHLFKPMAISSCHRCI